MRNEKQSRFFFELKLLPSPNNTFYVRLYDFGGHHDIHVSRDDTLVHLPENLLSPPSLRHRCSLFNISMTNSRESAQFLYSLVRSKLVTIETKGLMHSKASHAVSFLLCESMKIAGSGSSLDIYEAVKESKFSRDFAPPSSLRSNPLPLPLQPSRTLDQPFDSISQGMSLSISLRGIESLRYSRLL